MFPSPTSAEGHLKGIGHHHPGISKAGGTRFWLQCARLTGASAAGESPAGKRQATTSTPSHGLPSVRTEVKR